MAVLDRDAVNKQDLQNLGEFISSIQNKYKYRNMDHALSAMADVAEYYLDDEDDTIYIQDVMWDAADSVFWYYQDALDYLDRRDIYDYSAPISEWDATNLSQFAMYFLLEDMHQILNDFEAAYYGVE